MAHLELTSRSKHILEHRCLKVLLSHAQLAVTYDRIKALEDRHAARLRCRRVQLPIKILQKYRVDLDRLFQLEKTTTTSLVILVFLLARRRRPEHLGGGILGGCVIPRVSTLSDHTVALHGELAFGRIPDLISGPFARGARAGLLFLALAEPIG